MQKFKAGISICQNFSLVLKKLYLQANNTHIKQA
jgi:hypothetical protein